MTLDEAKRLSPDEINTVIAVALEWFKRPGDGWIKNGTSQNGNFFHDLNACHEAEKALTFDEIEMYFECLDNSIAGNSHYRGMEPPNIRAIALAVVLSERKK